MILFSPWRNESELYSQDQLACFGAFEKRFETIQQNRSAMLPFSSTLEQIKETITLLEDERANDYCDGLDSTFQQEQDDDLEYLDAPDMSELPHEAGERNSKGDVGNFRQIKIVDDDQMKADVRALSIGQRTAFERTLSYCKQLLFSRSKFSTELDPPRIIITGK